jgi:non-specific serine/threonine protein kinase
LIDRRSLEAMQDTLQQLQSAGAAITGGERVTVGDNAEEAFYVRPALVEAAEQGLTGPEQSLWLERLEREHGNLRAALAWTQSSPEIDVGLRMAAALQRFWWWHGHWSEGRRWLERLLAMVENNTSAVAPKVHAGALRALASLSFFQAQSEADLTRASVLAEQALALYRAIHDLEGVARTLTVVANVASEQGDLSRAEVLYTEALALVRDLGNRSGIASVLTNLAHLAVERKDFARASALYEESETLFRILADTEGRAHAVEALAELDYLQSDFTQATQRYAHSLAIAGSLGDRWMSPICVAGLGLVARSTGRRSHATRLLGAAAGMWTALGVEVNLRPPMVAEYHAALAALRAELGDEAFTAAWTEGENMTLEQAIAYATSTATP